MMLRIGALVIVVLVGLLILSPPAARDPVVDVANAASRSVIAEASSVTVQPDTSALVRRDLTRAADLFTPKAKPVVRPVPTPAAEPAPPPSLPFRYLGRYTEGESIVLFLATNDRSLMAKAGDVIDGVFKVESIDDRQILFTHLPTNQSLALSTGESGK